MLEDASFGGALAWAFGSGFPKNHSISKAIDKAAGAEREVIGRSNRKLPKTKFDGLNGGAFQEKPGMGEFLTAPATHAARQWEGWGTALKPAMELICVARKPLAEGTIAANVLAHGTGAINIDGCRVETDENLNGGAYAEHGARRPLEGDAREGAALGMFQPGKTATASYKQPIGRWPANVCLSYPEDEFVLRPDVTVAEKAELYRWLSENT